MYSYVHSINLQLFENLNDAYMYIILMPMFATQLVNKVKMEQIIVFMRKECFLATSFKVL